MTIYAIGDIHGMAKQLKERLAAIRRHADAHDIEKPTVVFVGDYVDRGPDSKAVLDILSGPGMAGFEPQFLLGNHDAFFLSAVNGRSNSNDIAVWLRHTGGAETLESYGGSFRRHGPYEFLRRTDEWLPPAHKAFLIGLRTSWRKDDLFFSHAGFDPSRPLEQQTPATLLYGDSDMFEYDEPWLAAKLRERMGALAVHGHWTETSGVQVWPHRIGIDTGAGFAAGRLTAVAIEENGAVEILPWP